MNIKIPLILCILSGLGTLLGSLLVFIPKINKTKYKRNILLISSSIMLLISIFDLLPNNLLNILNNYYYKGLIISTILFILGSITIIILEKYLSDENIYNRVGILNFISLLLHNIPEGIATFITTLINPVIGVKLSLTIMLHNIPEGLLIMIPHSLNNKKRRGLILSFIAAIAEPIGGLLFYLILKNYINEFTINYILIYVSGLMITLAINNISNKNL